MAKWLLIVAWCLAGLGWSAGARAGEAAPAVADPALEARVMAVAAELRCLVCQNQTIADSHADLASDLRREIRGMLLAGKSEREITEFMVARYGDFVLYRPPFKAQTVLLWLGPAALLLIALGLLWRLLRQRQRLGDEAFEPDTAESPDTPVPTQEPTPHGR